MMKVKDWFYYSVLVMLSLPIGLVCCEAIVLQIIGLGYGYLFFRGLFKPLLIGRNKIAQAKNDDSIAREDDSPLLEMCFVCVVIPGVSSVKIVHPFYLEKWRNW